MRVYQATAGHPINLRLCFITKVLIPHGVNMRTVFQTIMDANRGDCHRAAVASLLDLDISQVPHFRLFPEDMWHEVFHGFLWGCGFDWEGTGYPDKHGSPAEYSHIDGFVVATVPSKTFEGKSHAVVMNLKGMVAHDPNPNKSWLGINIIESGDLKHWSLIGKRVAEN